MLRSRFLAVACVAVLSSVSARVSAQADPATVVAPAASSSSDASAAKPDAQPSDQNTAAPQKATESGTPAEASIAKDTRAPEKSKEKSEEKSEVKSEVAAKPTPPPPPTLTAKIDLAKQTMVVAEDGDVKYSSGAEEFPTPRGTFRPQWVAKMWYSRKYDNAPMPNAVFISGGVAIHATQHVSSLGRPASHGCIRLAPGNAKTFYNLVGKHGLKMTRVSVYGNPKWRSPAVAARNVPSRRYAARQDSGSWFSSPKQYRHVSAYDPGFTQRKYRQVYRPVPRGYYYADAPPRVYYQRRNNNRVVYVQRPQRRYYYNSSGYGYGGGW
jgi:lipoprotein-anchoring transpeptidase ErfK/SrfK